MAAIVIPGDDAAPRTTRAPLPLANFASLGSGELVSRVIAFVVTAMLTRRLGVSGFGQLAFATAITSFLIVTPNLAIQDLGSRAIARAPQEAARIVASVTRIRLPLGMAGVLAVVILALLLPSASPSQKALIALSGLSVIPQSINASWGYKALERTHSVGAALVLTQVVSVIGVLLFVHDGANLLRVPAVQAAGELAAAVLLARLLVADWSRGSVREGRALVEGAGTIMLNRVLRAIIVTADMVLLGQLVDAAQVGLYSAAYRVCFLLAAIAASAHIVFQPALMRAHDDPRAASAVLTDAIWLAAAVGFPLVAGGMMVAPDLLALLFGEPFRLAGGAFRILLLSTGVLFIHGALYGAYIARHQLKAQTRVIGAAAALNLGLNALLIRPYGIMGAAVATLAAELLILMCTATLLWQWEWRPAFSVLARPTIAAGLMCGVLALVPPSVHVLLRIVAAGAAYLVALSLMGALPPQIRDRLSRVLART